MSQPSAVALMSPETAHRFAPSEYTGLLLAALRARPDEVQGRQVCEIGTGSGVIALQAAALGAARVVATDIELDALALAASGSGPDQKGCAQVELRSGTMWRPLAGERFDLILANLPHFPAESLAIPGRLPSWGAGGPDGRRLLDLFLSGLDTHMTADGTALFTHNRFVGLEKSGSLLADKGLGLEVVSETAVLLPPAKVAALSDEARRSDDIFQLGDYVFGRVCIVAARRAGARGAS